MPELVNYPDLVAKAADRVVTEDDLNRLTGAIKKIQDPDDFLKLHVVILHHYMLTKKPTKTASKKGVEPYGGKTFGKSGGVNLDLRKFPPDLQAIICVMVYG